MANQELQFAVTKLLQTYRMNPAALVKAFEGLINAEVEKRQQTVEADIALRVCERLHPAGSSGVMCRDCATAMLSELQDQETTS